MTITLFDIPNKTSKKISNVSDVKIIAYGFKIIFENGKEKTYSFSTHDFFRC